MAGTPAAEIVVTAETVSGLLADQLPQYAAMPVRLAGEGWDNFMYRLGDELAVRMPRREASVQLIVNEQTNLPRIAPGLPLRVPAPVAIGRAGRGYPWPWSIVPWIAGTPVDHAPLDADQGPALAGFLRALHAPAPDDVPVSPARGNRLETRRERFGQCLDRLRASSDVITPAIDTAWQAAMAAPFPEMRVWLHGDMHAQNVLSDRGRLSGVIDWGDLCAGDPAVDLCSVWVLLADVCARDEALRGYAPDEALLARAQGWAILFGASLFENGRMDDPRDAAIGEATLRRLAEDL